MNFEDRGKRKLDHLIHCVSLENKINRDVFSDITLLHNCLSEINFDDIDISSSIGQIQLTSPIIINAITGGMREGRTINRELSKVARDLDLALAVGSQKIALDDKTAAKSFTVARKVNPTGRIFANLGSDITICEAKKAIEMIEANALQLHLNVPQELVMPEGRKRFKGTVDNICEIAQNVKVPVIVKEVGFGMAREEARLLVKNNIKILDIGGRGGTDFVAIENARRGDLGLKCLEGWGVPTAANLIEVIHELGAGADIICSGGLSDGLDIAKALALGAKAAALAGNLLYVLTTQGPKSLRKHILNMTDVIKYVMVMVGARRIKDLRDRPVIITGFTKEWMENRGIRS